MDGGVLERQYLFDRLDAATTRLAVLSAPSGFGKTTLARSWVSTLDAQTTAIVWVSLTTRLTEVSEFWSRIGSGLARFGVVPDGALQEALELGHDPVQVIGRALQDRPGPIVVVVDAYEHAVEVAETIDEALRQLVVVDPMLRIVLTTRGGSSLTSAAGRLAVGVDVLDERDLAFRAEETVQLLRARGMNPDAAASVHADTNGYPLAVRAVALGMRHALGPLSEPADWRSVVADVILDQLPPTARTFLLESTVPPYFDEQLAAQLVPGEEIARMLRDLELAGLGRWIPYAPRRSVFQYADAVRDAVRESTARMDPSRFHRAAGLSALWLLELGEDEAALELAVSGRRLDLATQATRRIVVRNPLSYTTDHLGVALSSVPHGQLVKFPILALARGLSALTSVATRGAAAEYLRIVATWVDSEEAGRTRAEQLFDHAARVVSQRLIGEFADGAANAKRGLAFDESYPDIGDEHLVELRPMVMRHFAYTIFQAGDVETAVEAMARAASAAAMPWSRNHTLSYTAGILAIAGRREEAERATSAIDPEAWAPGQEFSYINAMGRVARATSYLDDFRFTEALAEYASCESFLETAEFWPFVTWTQMLARLGLGEAESEAGRVEERLATTPPPPGAGANLGMAALHNALAVLWLAEGRQAKAAAHLDQRTPFLGQVAPGMILYRLAGGDPSGALNVVSGIDQQRGHTIRSRAAAATLGAAAALRINNQALALSLLRRGVALNRAHGARAHLMWVPDLDLSALRQLAKENDDDQVSGYLEFEAQPRIVFQNAPEQLSEREQVVLQMLVRFSGRQEIAAALHVSANTVKSQVRSIYRKLGVSTRAAAIERAMELDLLVGMTGSPSAPQPRRAPEALGPDSTRRW